MNKLLLTSLLFLSFLIGKSQNSASYQEIYDFDAGDIFEFNETAQNNSYPGTLTKKTKREILQVSFSSLNDSVLYEVLDSTLQSFNAPMNSYIDSLIVSQQTISYRLLDSIKDIHPICDSNAPSYDSLASVGGQPFCELTDTIYSFVDTCLDSIIVYELDEMTLLSGGTISNFKYSKGLGLAYKYWQDHDGSGGILTKTYNLTYYKKVSGKTKCTKRQYVGINDLTDNKSIKLFPNPTSQSLNIKSDKPIANISIYNTVGKQIKTVTINKQIDVSELKTGVYFLKAQFKDGKHSITKFIKE